MNDSPPLWSLSPHWLRLLSAYGEMERLAAGGTETYLGEAARMLDCLAWSAEQLASLIGKQEGSEKTQPN